MYIIIYTTTQRDVYILNFAITLYTLQLDAHTVVPFLYGPPHHRPQGLYGDIFIAIAFFNTNYLSPAATRSKWSGLVEESYPLQPIASRILHSLITNKKQIKWAYHTFSSFLAKYHIHGIVAMLDVSNVDNVWRASKDDGQVALKQGH